MSVTPPPNKLPPSPFSNANAANNLNVNGDMASLKAQQAMAKSGAAVDVLQNSAVSNPFSAAARKAEDQKPVDPNTTKPAEPPKKKSCGGAIGSVFHKIDNIFKKVLHVVTAPLRFVAKAMHKVGNAILKYNPFSLIMRKLGMEKFDPNFYLRKANDGMYKGFVKGEKLAEKGLDVITPEHQLAKLDKQPK
jgi:hypothetical protein